MFLVRPFRPGPPKESGGQFLPLATSEEAHEEHQTWTVDVSSPAGGPSYIVNGEQWLGCEMSVGWIRRDLVRDPFFNTRYLRIQFTSDCRATPFVGRIFGLSPWKSVGLLLSEHF